MCSYNQGYFRCHGNAIAVGRLIKGMTIPEVIQHLDGVICGNKGTSCTDQLAKCLQEYLDKKQLDKGKVVLYN